MVSIAASTSVAPFNESATAYLSFLMMASNSSIDTQMPHSLNLSVQYFAPSIFSGYYLMVLKPSDFKAASGRHCWIEKPTKIWIKTYLFIINSIFVKIILKNLY